MSEAEPGVFLFQSVEAWRFNFRTSDMSEWAYLLPLV